MRSDVITFSGGENQTDKVLDQVEKVVAYKGLTGKAAIHLRLLAEEMTGIMRSVAGDAKGEFWIEDKDGVYELHLKVRTLMDERRRDMLISASTEGKNEAIRGLMGKIRTLFAPSGDAPVFSGLFMPGSAPQMYSSLDWSMEDYREQLEQYREQNRDAAQEAWDELEKSVVAHVADNVLVSVRGRDAEMTIVKNLK